MASIIVCRCGHLLSQHASSRDMLEDERFCLVKDDRYHEPFTDDPAFADNCLNFTPDNLKHIEYIYGKKNQE